jgi:hypothetical protein
VKIFFYRSSSNSTVKSPVHPPTFYPPPPPAFSSQQDSPTQSKSSHVNERHFHPSQQQQQCYQPYRFDSNGLSPHQQKPTRESQIIPGKSLSVHHHKSSHPPIPRQFLQSNINGTQSLKQHQSTSRPSALSIPSNHFVSLQSNFDFPIQTSQQPTTSRTYLQFENPANV